MEAAIQNTHINKINFLTIFFRECETNAATNTAKV